LSDADAKARDSSPLDRRLRPSCVAPATKTTRSNPLSVPLSERSFRLGQGDLSKIDMRMDIVRYSDLVLCSAVVIDTTSVIK
jgi:hypothetical protein